MCEGCFNHRLPSCGFEEKGISHECPYNKLISEGYKLAEKDLTLTWKDIMLIDRLCKDTPVPTRISKSNVQFYMQYYIRVLERFKKKRSV